MFNVVDSVNYLRRRNLVVIARATLVEEKEWRPKKWRPKEVRPCEYAIKGVMVVKVVDKGLSTITWKRVFPSRLLTILNLDLDHT